MASFRRYDNSNVIATVIITNFHLCLIQLWWQFCQIFVFGDVVYAQTWEVLTLKKLYRAALKVDWNEKRLPGRAWVVTHEFKQEWGGVLFLECDQRRNQKRDQANVKLRKLFPKILSQAEHKKFQSRFLLEQLRCLSLMIIFAPKQNAANISVTFFPSLPYWVFLPLLAESVRAVFRMLTS